MAENRIDDAHDERLDPYRRLKDVGVRRDGRFIAESELVLERVLGTGTQIESIVLTPARLDRLRSRLAVLPLAVPIYVVPPTVLDAVVGFPLHRGVLALVRRPDPVTIDDLLAGARTVVALEDVVDPDNVGSVFRHAACFGADAVVLSEHAGDPLYRKAVRTSMGWVLSIPFARADRNIVAVLRARGFTTCAFAADGEHSLAEVAASRPNRLAMIVGAESTGLRPDTLADADLRVRIPIVSSVDSLNVATAVAIGLYEFTRSPRRPDGPGDCPPRG